MTHSEEMSSNNNCWYFEEENDRSANMFYFMTQNLRVYTVPKACYSTHVPSNGQKWKSY